MVNDKILSLLTISYRFCSRFVEDHDRRAFQPGSDMIGSGRNPNALQDAGAEWPRAEASAELNDHCSRRKGAWPCQPRWISRCSTFIPMVQTAELRDGDDFLPAVGGNIGRVSGQSLSSER
jgi:hypothetical protein